MVGDKRMKKTYKVVLIIIFSLIYLSILGINTSAVIKTISPKKNYAGNYFKYALAKGKNPPIITNDKLPIYDISIIYKSNLIVKGTIINKSESAFSVYKNNKLAGVYYGDIISLKVNRIDKEDKTNSKVKIGSILQIYSESCSNHWVQGTIKLSKNKEYILFLSRTQNTNVIKYTKYAEYTINGPTWSPVLVDNGVFYVDEEFKTFYEDQYGNQKGNIRKDGKFQSKTYTSTNFESHLIMYLKIETENNADIFNLPINLNAIGANSIQSVKMINSLGEEKIINNTLNQARIILLLRSLKITGTEMFSRTGPPYCIQFIYLDGEKIKKESFGVNDTVISHRVLDKNNKLLSFGYYTIDKNILGELKTIYNTDDDKINPNPTGEDILRQVPDADIFVFNNLVYIKAEIQDSSLKLGEKVGTITKMYDTGSGFENGTATKLPVETDIYRPEGEKNDVVLLVEIDGKIIRYLAIMEG